MESKMFKSTRIVQYRKPQHHHTAQYAHTQSNHGRSCAQGTSAFDRFRTRKCTAKRKWNLRHISAIQSLIINRNGNCRIKSYVPETGNSKWQNMFNYFQKTSIRFCHSWNGHSSQSELSWHLPPQLCEILTTKFPKTLISKRLTLRKISHTSIWGNRIYRVCSLPLNERFFGLQCWTVFPTSEKPHRKREVVWKFGLGRAYFC